MPQGLTGGVQVSLACCLIQLAEEPVINIAAAGRLRLKHHTLKQHGSASRTIARLFVVMVASQNDKSAEVRVYQAH
jgi:hypothetical protein